MKLIVDSGSTKADWMFVTDQGLMLEHTKGINSMTQSPETIHAIISENNELVKRSEEVGVVHFYGAGCSKGETKEVVEAVLSAVFDKASIHVESDLMACALSTYSGKPIISCILGTGSNACYFDGDQIEQKIPALGYVIGDEASGTYFGKWLLRAYFYEKLPGDLRDFLEKDFSLNLQEVLLNVYRNPSPNKYLASYAKFVIEHKSHPYIAPIIEKGVRQFLERFVCCYLNSKEVEITFVGSVAYYLQDQIREVGAKLDLKIQKIIQKPIDGLVEYHR